jgi:hypothetical protein
LYLARQLILVVRHFGEEGIMLIAPREERELFPPSLHCKAHGGTVLCVAEIGMYRCSEQQHLERMSEAEQRLTTQAKSSEHVTRILTEHFANHDWTPWLYNQVVGWLRIYVYPKKAHCSACISGEYYAVDSKRLSASLKNKRFLWAAEAFAVVMESETEAEIFNRITKEIQCWAKSERIRKITLDLTTWNNVGPFIDWERILKCRAGD